MPPKPSLIGQTFGKLTVIAEAPRRHRQAFSVCRCVCGRKTVSNNSNLKAGRTKSCVHCRQDRHGMTKTPTYQSWMKMKVRCFDQNHISYPNYGGRGITICERWLVFENFLADMGVRPEGTTLDRINNDQNYCKENCRWATRIQQANNSRWNRNFTVRGVSGTLAELCRHFNVTYRTVHHRIDQD